MTKSQNTKNEQQKDLCITSEQLTEQWKASEKYNKHLEEVIKVYERKDKQATETSIAYNELLEENTKLKELLRECRPALVRFVSYDDSEENARILLMNEINEVLK